MPQFLDIETFKRMPPVIDFSDDDVAIYNLLDMAESYIGDPLNGILRRQVVKADFVENFDTFTAVSLNWPDEVSDVVVTYLDEDDVTQTVGDIYTVEDGGLVLNYDEEWPSPAKNIIVSYSSGWDAGDVPHGIRKLGYYVARTFYEKGDDIDPQKFRAVIAIHAAPFRRAEL